jgi:hypothetical protein
MNFLIAGLPKTGTTAAYFLLENSITSSLDFAFEPKPPFSAPSGSDSSFLAKVVYANTWSQQGITLGDFLKSFQNFDKCIWLVRDPRDQIVSTFLYTWYKSHRMPEDLYVLALEFVKRKEAGEAIPLSFIFNQIFGRGYYHNQSYYPKQVTPFFRSKDHGFYLFNYTDLVDKKFQGLSDFLSMKIKGDFNVADEYKRVARTKSYGGWRAWFEPEDVDYFRPIFSEYMQLLNIPDDWELNDERIDPAFSSEYMQKLHEGAL